MNLEQYYDTRGDPENYILEIIGELSLREDWFADLATSKIFEHFEKPEEMEVNSEH